jgi:phosphate-selective porin OprO/OprP
MERKHAEQYDALNNRYQALIQTIAPVPVPDLGAGGPSSQPVRDEDFPRRDTSREGGAGARDNPSDPGRSRRPSQRPLPSRVEFGPGFQISSDDDEFQLQFHNLTQIDYRQYTQPGQDSVHSGYSIPRQRWYFMGRMTRSIEFYTTINRGFGTLDLFDAFINYRYDDRLMFKVGRFKTPFSYEFYAMSAPDFIVPERSLFNSNFSPNRELGFMSWGQLADKRVDYAVGMFNGNRLSFQDTNEEKDVISYINARPFGAASDDDSWVFLKYLNIGGSVDFGNQNNAPLPAVLRTSLAASNAADAVNIAPPFLTFNKNVLEHGLRSLWGMHLAYFYKHLSLVGEWESGYQSYTTGLSSYQTKVPVNAYYVTAGYFLTGETVDRRTQIEPLRPFCLRKGKFGPGAIELQGRYSTLELGRSVFTGGLADPNQWTNRLYTVDLGLNWYLNAYTKIVLEWEHAVFGQPVLDAPGKFQLTSDLFWARFQVYF